MINESLEYVVNLIHILIVWYLTYAEPVLEMLKPFALIPEAFVVFFMVPLLAQHSRNGGSTLLAMALTISLASLSFGAGAALLFGDSTPFITLRTLGTGFTCLLGMLILRSQLAHSFPSGTSDIRKILTRKK